MKETFKTRTQKKHDLSEWNFKLLKRIKGKKILCDINSVSRSGMTRKMSFFIANKDGSLQEITYLISEIAGYNTDKNCNLIVRGCGMDMIFSVLSDFNYAIAPLVTGIPLNDMLKSGEYGRIYDTFYVNANTYQTI